MLCLAAPRIQAQLHPSRHLGPCSRRHPALCPPHPRPATHPPSGLWQGLFGFLLLPLFSHWLGPLFMQCSASSSTLFPAIQICTCFLTGQKKQFMKTPGKFTGHGQSSLLYPESVRDRRGPASASPPQIPAQEPKLGRDHSHEPAWHFPHPSEPLFSLN